MKDQPGFVTNPEHLLKCTRGRSQLIWEQDGTNVSFISDINVRFLSCVISLIACHGLDVLTHELYTYMYILIVGHTQK